MFIISLFLSTSKFKIFDLFILSSNFSGFPFTSSPLTFVIISPASKPCSSAGLLGSNTTTSVVGLFSLYLTAIPV